MTRGHVEVDLYSGRPNPAWDLSAEDAERLWQWVGLLSLIPSAAVAEHAPDRGLGYRGMRVEIQRDGGYGRLVVGNGIIRVASEDAADPGHRDDPGGRVERWLLQTGAATLGAALLNYLLSQLPSGDLSV